MSVTDAVLTTESGSRRAEVVRLFLQPIAALVLVGAVLVWAFTQDLDAIEVVTLNPTTLLRATGEHVLITAAVTFLVVVVAIPLGIVLTRRWARWIAPVFLGIATIGQAAPAIGVIVLYFLWTEQEGLWAVTMPLAFVSLLPVLRNTIVGIQQVDDGVLDAARGMGMSPRAVLFKVELPLAVPIIGAGARTALVLAVGTVPLGYALGAGGLGLALFGAIKTNRPIVTFTVAVMIAALALLLDWVAGVLQRLATPRGIR